MNAQITGLSEEPALVHGPPGTGKTQVLVTLVYSLFNSGEQVLVCAPLNIATDHLFKALGRIIGKGVWRLRDCTMWNNEGRIESFKDSENSLQPYTSDKTIQKQVLCCTCVGAGIKFDKIQKNDRFDAVIIDEVAQATELETLIPIVRSRKKLTLFGDDCQLGPVVLDDETRQSGLAYSMFRRLLMLPNIANILLNEQYRINFHIWEATSKTFYNGRVYSMVDQVDGISGCPEFP